jgi:predicted chitinase
MITIELLQKVCPGTKKTILEKYVGPLYTIALYYDIADTKERTAAFIAQLAHESGGFNIVIENLNYSAEGLTLETPSGAAVSAGWFWDTNKLNSYRDKNDFIGLTKRINGGTNGLADRQHHYEVALQYLKV